MTDTQHDDGNYRRLFDGDYKRLCLPGGATPDVDSVPLGFNARCTTRQITLATAGPKQIEGAAHLAVDEIRPGRGVRRRWRLRLIDPDLPAVG